MTLQSLFRSTIQWPPCFFDYKGQAMGPSVESAPPLASETTAIPYLAPIVQTSFYAIVLIYIRVTVLLRSFHLIDKAGTLQ